MRIKSLHLTKGFRTALLFLLLGTVGMMKGYAYDFVAVCPTGQTLYFRITDANNHFIEICCPGNDESSAWSGFMKPSGDIILPETVEYDNATYTVTSIGYYAFLGCSGLTGTLTIPNSVNTIKGHAFKGCNGFTGDLIIPNSVTTIGGSAFYGCAGFSGSLSIGNSITTIEGYTFNGCSGFSGSLAIGNSVTSIEYNAFSGCSGFTGNLIIPSLVTSIGNSAFSNCSGITNITLPYSLVSIGFDAFKNCNGLTCVYYTGDIAQWCNISFGYHTSNPIYYSHNLYINNSLVTNLIIPTTVTEIKNYAFSGCSGAIGLLNLPNTLTSIGDYAFYNCSGLIGGVTIPNSVLSIGDYAFSGCSGFMGNLVIGNSVVTIGNNAFHNCSYFTGDLTIPNSVTNIGDRAFASCNGFWGNLTFGNAVSSIGAYAFHNCSGFTGNLVFPNTLLTIGEGAFWGCGNFTGDLTIPNSVSTIGNYAFYQCYSFSGNLTIPNSITVIGENVFNECINISGSLIIPNSVLSIGNRAFYHCWHLGDIIVGSSVASIGSEAFLQCGSQCNGELTTTIPESVLVIGISAFKNCSHLTEVNMLSFMAPSIGYDVFTNNAVGRVINIPCNATPNYSTGYWTEWADALHEVCDDYTITTTVDPVDGGTASGGGTFDYAATCTLIATPNPGYHFVNWTKDDIEVSTEATYSFVVSEDGAYVANFAANVYFISVGANPTNGGTVTGGNSGGYGSLVTLIATPNEGYCFVNWTKNGEIVSTEPTYSFMVTESAAYQANFAQQSFHFTTAGNWSVASNWLENELPGSTDQVFINANCTLDTNAEAVALTVDSDIVLTIQEVNTLSISGTITTPSTTSLIIADGGQLVTDNAVNGTIQKSILGYGESEDGYYFIASPVDDFNPNDGGLLTSSYDLYYFDQAQEGEEWRNYEAASFNLNTGKGCLYASQTDVTLNISGELTAAKDPVELVNQTGVAFEGWNLIGNPYPCNVTINVPFYRMYSDGSGLATQTTNLETTAIKPMEGVFVQYTTEAPSVTFTKAPNVSAEGSRGALNLSLGQGRGVKDNAIIRFDGGKTLEKFSLRKGGSSIFITEGNKDYAVVNAEKQGEIPVSFKTEKNGSYTLSFSNEDVEFSYLHLIDNMTGNDVDLLHTPRYSFEAKTTDYASRFRLVFSTDGNANDESFGFVNAMGNFCIYGIEGDATVQVIDAMGRILSSETFSGSCEKQLGGAAGVYVVRLISGDSVRTQKIVVR